MVEQNVQRIGICPECRKLEEQVKDKQNKIGDLNLEIADYKSIIRSFSKQIESLYDFITISDIDKEKLCSVLQEHYDDISMLIEKEE